MSYRFSSGKVRGAVPVSNRPRPPLLNHHSLLSKHESAKDCVGAAVCCPRISDDVVGIVHVSRRSAARLMAPEAFSGFAVPVVVDEAWARSDYERHVPSWLLRVGSAGKSSAIADSTVGYVGAIDMGIHVAAGSAGLSKGVRPPIAGIVIAIVPADVSRVIPEARIKPSGFNPTDRDRTSLGSLGDRGMFLGCLGAQGRPIGRPWRIIAFRFSSNG
jgi:hypothetical protein